MSDKIAKDTTFSDNLQHSKVLTLGTGISIDIQVTDAGGLLCTNISNENHPIFWVDHSGNATAVIGNKPSKLAITSLGSGKIRITNNIGWWIPIVWLG